MARRQIWRPAPDTAAVGTRSSLPAAEEPRIQLRQAGSWYAIANEEIGTHNACLESEPDWHWSLGMGNGLLTLDAPGRSRVRAGSPVPCPEFRAVSSFSGEGAGKMTCAEDARRLEFAALAAARGRMYAFLSGVFGAPPRCSQLEALHDEGFWADAQRVLAEAILAPLRAWIGEVASTEEMEGDVRREFLELFRLPGRKYVAPYESVYGDVREVAGERFRGLLMGPSATDVRRWYRLVEAGGGEENDDLPDHIGLELGFLGRLCVEEQTLTPQVEMSRLERVWEIERDFLAAHVVRWVRALRDTIYAKSQHSYFRAAADMVVEFTMEDSRRLEALVGPARARKCSKGNAHEG